jgi:hypothetical protein
MSIKSEEASFKEHSRKNDFNMLPISRDFDKDKLARRGGVTEDDMHSY